MFEHVLEIVDDEIKNLNLSEETKESVKGKKLIIASQMFMSLAKW